MRQLSICMRVFAMVCTVILMGVCASSAHGFDWGKIKRGAGEAYRGSSGGLSNDEVIRGLKQALEIGAKNAARSASKLNGYYKNPLIFIPFPPEAKRVKEFVEAVGMKKQVEDFVMTLNRAAEEAAKEAAPIFLGAITSMTIEDGFRILKGADDAATQYLRGRTMEPLRAKFRPVAKRAIDKVQVTRHWNPVISTYNKAPLVEKVNPDLDAYVTERALAGLFKLIAKEERNIRKNPSARVTDLLRRVFGS